jgi:diaminohydroxyphosphoribosylaminopyrimidine deaminase/5-amino-6-(5-phosphoribosylamino)uracil reductase
VVVGLRDPNPHVAGGGIERLRAAGVEVTVGVLAARCRYQNRGYLRWLASGRPHLILKAAVSLDGRLAPRPAPGGRQPAAPQWLTSDAARLHAHRLRDACDAILVGAGTVLADNPRLTVRIPGRADERQPLRVVLDGALRVDPTAQLCGPGTLVLTSRCALVRHPQKAEALQKRGVELCELPPPSAQDVAPRSGLEPTSVDLYAALHALGQRQLLMVMCEGGATLHGALLDAGLYDEVALYLAPLFLGEEGVPLLRHFTAPSVAAAPWLAAPQVETLGPDLFVSGMLQRGSYFPATTEREGASAQEGGSHVHRAG